MALYAMDSEKLFQGEYWTNRYIITAASLDTAVAEASQIQAAERAVHSSLISFTKYRVSDRVAGTDVYQVIQTDVQGNRPAGTAEFLPMFVCVRCDFNTVGGGRPSRKYLHCMIFEEDNVNGFLTTARRDAVKAQYVDVLVGLAGYVDVDGQDFSGGSVALKLTQHQFRRGTKRRLQPIIP